jgi:DNA-binding transcriptional MerR regulator
LSRSEAARALGIGVSTLQAWERDGLAPPSFTAPGGRRMYPVSRLIEWAEAKAGITAESRAGD